jgi:hypothetical protein
MKMPPAGERTDCYYDNADGEIPSAAICRAVKCVQKPTTPEILRPSHFPTDRMHEKFLGILASRRRISITFS